MDKFVVPLNPSSSHNPKPPKRRQQWKRSEIELNGKFDSQYRHHLSSLLIQSYSEIGAFPHTYHANGEACRTHIDSFIDTRLSGVPSLSNGGVTSLEFDSKGVYLASVTKSGCLTVHDFDTLHNPEVGEDESKQLLHISTCEQLDVVSWNLANQDEIACTSTTRSEIHIFDIAYDSSEPAEVLKKRATISVRGWEVPKGFSDIAFCSDDKLRLFASDTNGLINVWDRRVGYLPRLELTANSDSTLNSIKLSADNQIIFGACKKGRIYMWDLRGGTSSTTFHNNKEGYNSPVTSLKLSQKLEKIPSLKAQSNIVSNAIHSIDINPCCPYQLAFHLDDGWSGVLDIHKWQVTHIHCPPPPWLDDFYNMVGISLLRKPCWLPSHSIYAIGSASSLGLYLLDFYPDRSSPCHIDCKEEMERTDKSTSLCKQNKLLPLSEHITACAAHPLNGTIVAGTKISSLMLISQTGSTF